MKILDGIKIVNLAVNLPGPAASQNLSRMGAEVVKVEAPSGDPMEIYHAGWYKDMAAGHTLVRIDLKSEEGRTELDQLLGSADLLISASRPAAMARLGLDWASLHQKFPQLCQVAIVGYPAPRENEAGHDLTYQASLGLLNPPHMPRTLLADMAGAEMTTSAALALLLERERGRPAGYAEVALSEAAASLAEPLRYGCTSPGALLGGGIPEYNIYKTADGWVAVAALEPHFKKRLEEALAIATPDQYREAFAGRSSAHWQEWGLQQDVPIETVRDQVI
jgi:crotonobetainyl-CoA:carnitine CoA-transferase CaiB-like acyl-CoA transferase